MVKAYIHKIILLEKLHCVLNEEFRISLLNYLQKAAYYIKTIQNHSVSIISFKHF